MTLAGWLQRSRANDVALALASPRRIPVFMSLT